MGGESKSTQTQNSTTNPWEQAQPALTGILGQVQGNLGNTALTNPEAGALNTSVANANNYASQYGGQIGGYAQNLLNGGGAMDQAGNVDQNYQRYVDQTNP